MEDWLLYREGLDPNKIGFQWHIRSWQKTHGDSKSNVSGRIRASSIATADGKYKAKLTYNNETLVIVSVERIHFSKQYTDTVDALQRMCRIKKKSKQEKEEIERLKTWKKQEEVATERRQTAAALNALDRGVEVCRITID